MGDTLFKRFLSWNPKGDQGARIKWSWKIWAIHFILKFKDYSKEIFLKQQFIKVNRFSLTLSVSLPLRQILVAFFRAPAKKKQANSYISYSVFLCFLQWQL